jgi:ATP-dependent RNA helicase DeaD
MEQFGNLGLSKAMLKTLALKGFTEPTPIQQTVIPFLLNDDRDVVAQAETGTGKTAAFGIPIIERLHTQNKDVKALVLVPTRELAFQVAGEISSLRKSRNLEVLPVYGGQGFALQLKSLKRGVDIVVGTPGRLLDHLRRGSLCLDSLSFLVLDEADQMLDMGFIEDIKTILSYAPVERRTMLFSATMPSQVISMARRYMNDYESILMSRKDPAGQLTEQKYFQVREQDKFEALCRIIDMEPEFYGLVFCRTRADTAQVAERLLKRGYEAGSIHGDIDQFQREKIMSRFRNKDITVLVATDVAARGIDISNLSHVINYAIPQDPDSYIHRIGRTGRAGKKGVAITFVTSRENRTLETIHRRTGKAIRRGHIPGVHEVIDAKSVRIRSEIEQIIHNGDFGNYAALATDLLKTGDAGTVLAACLRHAFSDELDTSSYGEIRQVNPVDTTSYTRLFVARGRKHGITPTKLMKLVRQQSGLKENPMRNIEIMEDFSYISVVTTEADLIRKKFRKKPGRPIISKAKQVGKQQHPGKTRKEKSQPIIKNAKAEKRRGAAG